MHKDRLVVAALVGWLLVGLLSAAPQFVPGPSARYTAATAYDSQRDVVVLFGGAQSGCPFELGDTWEWDGVSWYQRTPSGPVPPARAHAAMWFDPTSGSCLLFGGVQCGQAPLNDLWEWDGQSWVEVTPALSPSPRAYHAVVFDEVRQQAVLFGGTDGNQQAGANDETWVYASGSWTELILAGPSPRWGHGMAFDDHRGRVVLHGGEGQLDDTWEWDGVTWQSVGSGPALATHGFAYHGASQRCISVGAQGIGMPTETWSWDGQNWVVQSTLISPPSRIWIYDALVEDASRDEVVLMGGYANHSPAIYGDTWAFDGTEWRPKLDYVTSPVNGNRYALTPVMGWQAAEDLAVLEGGHLATVRNQAEQAWLWQQFPGPCQHIGFTDAAVEGQWVWTSGEATGFTAWGIGGGVQEPAGGTAENGACLSGGLGGDWADIPTVMLGNSDRGIIEIVAPVPATASAFGVGCGSPALVLAPQGPPILGGLATAHIDNVPVIPGLPVALGGITLGFSDTFYGGLPLLPISLAAAGMPGCELLHSNDVFGLPVALGSSPGTWDFSLPIPANANLLNSHVYLQAFAGAPGYNAAQFIVSNGVDWLIGNQ